MVAPRLLGRCLEREGQFSRRVALRLPSFHFSEFKPPSPPVAQLFSSLRGVQKPKGCPGPASFSIEKKGGTGPFWRIKYFDFAFFCTRSGENKSGPPTLLPRLDVSREYTSPRAEEEEYCSDRKLQRFSESRAASKLCISGFGSSVTPCVSQQKTRLGGRHVASHPPGWYMSQVHSYRPPRGWTQFA